MKYKSVESITNWQLENRNAVHTEIGTPRRALQRVHSAAGEDQHTRPGVWRSSTIYEARTGFIRTICSDQIHSTEQ